MTSEKRLIDANVFWNRLRQVVYDIAENDDSGRLQLGYSPDIIEEVLKQTPTVDVVEVVHGRWKHYHKYKIAVCTNCSFVRSLIVNFGRAISCPNCGAKMDGGKDDDK